jgi:hypothetical protein
VNIVGIVDGGEGAHAQVTQAVLLQQQDQSEFLTVQTEKFFNQLIWESSYKTL